MKKIVSLAKKYLPFAVFAAFAVLIARALHFSVPSGDDYLFAVKATEGFFGAVAYGAKYLGEGIVGSFLRTALSTLPIIIRNMLCTAAILFTDVAAALIVSRAVGRTSTDSDGGDEKLWRSERFGTALLFTTLMLAFIPLSVLGEGVLSIAGTVHQVIPGALVLAAYLALDRAAERARGSVAAPITALFAALLSWQAAIAAAVAAAWFVVRSARKRAFRLSFAFALGAPLIVFAAHYILSNVPRFPDVSRLFALRSFFGEALAESGFFAALTALSVLVCARTLRERLIPAFRSKDRQGVGIVFSFALCFMCAANAAILVLHSSLVPGVSVSGTLTVLISSITLALTGVDYILALRKDPGAIEPLFALAALAAAVATLPTYTFGGAWFYLPLLLSFVVLGAEFLRVHESRAAISTLAALGAYFAATLCLTGAKTVIAAAIVLLCYTVVLSPALRRLRLTETLAVLLIMLTLFGIGTNCAVGAAIAAENERRIDAFKRDGGSFIILKGEGPGEANMPWYREYYALDGDTPIYFSGAGNTIPADLGDINGDGKINGADRTLFLRLIQD